MHKSQHFGIIKSQILITSQHDKAQQTIVCHAHVTSNYHVDLHKQPQIRKHYLLTAYRSDLAVDGGAVHSEKLGWKVEIAAIGELHFYLKEKERVNYATNVKNTSRASFRNNRYWHS